MLHKWIRIWKAKQTDTKIQLYFAVLSAFICLLALVIIPAYAWLSMKKSMETKTAINRPNALTIGSWNTQAISKLNLSDIDISGGKGSKDIVFCVYSYETPKFHLQLAHTTNIGFTYSIYPAKCGEEYSQNVSEITDAYDANVKYYFLDSDSGKLAGSYRNADGENNSIASSTGDYHNNTYDRIENPGTSYDYVQINAEPLYWVTTEAQDLNGAMSQTEEDGTHVLYYILRISWEDDVTEKNKETDMVYIIAESL